MTRNNCASAPKLLAHKKVKQDADGPVPGGFMLYMTMDRLPGVPLSSLDFWGLGRADRDNIRRAFKVALTYVFAP